MVLKKKLDNPILKENSLYSDIENIKWFGVQRMGLAVIMIGTCVNIVFLVRDIKKGGWIDLEDFKIEEFNKSSTEEYRYQ